MSVKSVVSNIRYWVLAAVVLAMVLGPPPFDPTIPMMAVLIMQMTVSMEGMELNHDTVSGRGLEMVAAVAFTFVLGTGVTLLAGLPFLSQHQDVWYGWVLLASVPCAISVVTVAMYFKGDMESSLVSVTAVYLAALVATPLLTHLFLGEAVSPLEIVKYIVLFIGLPLVGSQALRRLRPRREHKVVFINLMMFSIVFLAFSANRGALLNDWGVVAAIIALCVLRVFGVSLLMAYALQRAGDDRAKALVRVSMAVWKNSGLAATMALVLFPGMGGVALPAVISLVVENAWFALVAGRLGDFWGREPSPA